MLFQQKHWKQAIRPDHSARLAQILRNRPPDAESIQRLTKDMSTTLPKEGAIESKTLSFMLLCYAIDQVKKNVLGQKASTLLSNEIMNVVGINYVNSMDVDRANEERIMQLCNQCSESKETVWYAPKLKNFSTSMGHKISAVDFANSVKFENSERVLDWLLKQIPELQTQNSQMMEELHRLRKYGIKTSYFQDGMLHNPFQAWLFAAPLAVDLNEIGKSVSDMGVFAKNDVASIILVDKLNARNYGLKTNEETYDKNTSIFGVELAIPSYVAFNMDKKGELDASMGFGALPMREIFAKLGKEHVYELLRLSQILRLWDLVVPIMVANKAPSLLSATTAAGSAILSIIPKRRLFDPRLILPRARLLENQGETDRNLSMEVENALAETEKRISTPRRRHEVIGHVRRVRPGYKAAEVTRQLALRSGVALEGGETWVAKHMRGMGENVPIPKAISFNVE